MTTPDPEDYPYARAAWALATGQPWPLYDDLTDADLEAWHDLITNR